MKRIDFVGAPGVGKSTFYKALIKERGQTFKFLTLKEAQSEVMKNSFRKDLGLFCFFFSSFLMSISLLKKIRSILVKEIFQKYENLFLRDEKYNIGLDCFVNLVSMSTLPPKIKLLRYAYMKETLQNVIFLEKFLTPAIPVLFEESLTHRLISVGPWKSEKEKNFLCDLYHLVKGAECLIFLDAKDDVVIKRIKQRKQMNKVHQGMSKNQLERDIKKSLVATRQLIDFVEQKGVRVIKIDAQRPISEGINVLKKEMPSLF